MKWNDFNDSGPGEKGRRRRRPDKNCHHIYGMMRIRVGVLSCRVASYDRVKHVRPLSICPLSSSSSSSSSSERKSPLLFLYYDVSALLFSFPSSVACKDDDDDNMNGNGNGYEVLIMIRIPQGDRRTDERGMNT